MTKPKTTARKLAQRTIDQAKAAARIEEVVGDYVSLKRQGGNWVGLCPFHEDHTPSFYVSPAKQRATCYACGDGKSRDAIQFLRDHLNISFTEAVEKLAERYHIEVEYEAYASDAASDEAHAKAQAERTHRQELMEVSKRAAEYFARCLVLPDHAEALTYLHGRGISTKTLQVYGVGFASRADQGMGVVRAALKAEVSEEILVASGLAFSASKARFINRVLFPIRRVDGRVVGFGGRILPSEPDKKALDRKYLNTCETAVYKKHSLLFGLDVAHKAISQRKRATICEGYMDVLALYEAGIPNAVAACGTAFTAEQARLLARFCSTAVLCYDGDAAGAKATVTTMGVLLHVGIIPEVFVAPEGSDPASLLVSMDSLDSVDSLDSEEHPQELGAFIATHTVSYLEYLVGDCNVSTTSPAEYHKVMTRTAEVVACIRDAVVKDQAIRWVADRTGAAVRAVEGLVVSESAQVATSGGSHTGRGTSLSSVNNEGASQSALLEVIAPSNPRLAIEASIVGLLTEYPCQAFLDFVREEIVEDGASMQSVDIADILASLDGGVQTSGSPTADNSALHPLTEEEIEDRGDMLQDLVLLLKECVVLERMSEDGCDWEALGEMKCRLEGII